jgi:hypothetical protein
VSKKFRWEIIVLKRDVSDDKLELGSVHRGCNSTNLLATLPYKSSIPSECELLNERVHRPTLQIEIIWVVSERQHRC